MGKRQPKFVIKKFQAFAIWETTDPQWKNGTPLLADMPFTQKCIYPSPGSITKWPEWAQQFDEAGFQLIREWAETGGYRRYFAIKKTDLTEDQKAFIAAMDPVRVEEARTHKEGEPDPALVGNQWKRGYWRGRRWVR